MFEATGLLPVPPLLAGPALVSALLTGLLPVMALAAGAAPAAASAFLQPPGLLVALTGVEGKIRKPTRSPAPLDTPGESERVLRLFTRPVSSGVPTGADETLWPDRSLILRL